MTRRPLVAVSCELKNGGFVLQAAYVRRLVDAGALPVILPPTADLAPEDLDRFDGVVLSGGGDAHVAHWGHVPDPRNSPVSAERHVGETRLLAFLDERPQIPLLGVCLGMQLMALHAGGALAQSLDDVLPDAARHRDDNVHPIEGPLGGGPVVSSHRQGVADPGRLDVVALADDGVVEAVVDPRRPFALGVQWHPERTPDPALGLGIFRRFVDACAAARGGR